MSASKNRRQLDALAHAHMSQEHAYFEPNIPGYITERLDYGSKKEIEDSETYFEIVDMLGPDIPEESSAFEEVLVNA
jgi:hypothetical protein